MNGDGCDNNCTVTGCGNGVTTGTETCDDGDTMDGDGCSAACAPETGYTCTAAVPSVCTGTCGDGILAVGAETCDQGMQPDPRRRLLGRLRDRDRLGLHRRGVDLCADLRRRHDHRPGGLRRLEHGQL
jgi:cysteine-rich repeat protein